MIRRTVVPVCSSVVTDTSTLGSGRHVHLRVERTHPNARAFVRTFALAYVRDNAHDNACALRREPYEARHTARTVFLPPHNAGFVRKPRRHPTGAGCRLAVLSEIDHGTTTGQAVAPDVVHVTRPWIDGEIVPLAAM